MSKIKPMDFMAVGAHPDDVELFVGGTLLKLIDSGSNGVIVDLTDGAAGTRGSKEIRANEAAKAAKLLGVKREILNFPDSKLVNDRESQLVLIEQIRKYRPKIILTHYYQDEHPDHKTAGKIVRDSSYLSGLKSIETSGTPHRPKRVFYFPGHEHVEPSFCVDISNYWKKKLKLIQCYPSQFYSKNSGKFKGKTDLSTPAFLENLEIRNRYYGIRIRRDYAEPFICNEIPEVENITLLGGNRF